MYAVLRLRYRVNAEAAGGAPPAWYGTARAVSKTGQRLCCTERVKRRRVVSTLTGGRAGRGETQQTREARARVQLIIEITSKAGAYRKGLQKAAAQLSPEEAAIISDLEAHGLQVPQAHDILCGGHVLVDDPTLYEKWEFASVSHHRISSHHRDIDKKKYPDIGMRGVVVREKLHGRTANGTWVQLEKTPAAFGKRKLPSLDDVRHLMDYVVYRITRSNVGPWGLSRMTERHPLYLSPAVAIPVSLSPPVARSLTAALHRIEAADDTTSASGDLAGRFPPPDRADPGAELGQALSGRAGRGLFGNSEVWVTETPSPIAATILNDQPEPPPLKISPRPTSNGERR